MESTCEFRTPKAPACASISPDPMATFESRFISDANSGTIVPINTPVGRTSPRARCRNSVKQVDWTSSSSQSPWTLPSTQSPAIHPHLQTNGQTDLELNPVNLNVKKSAKSKARSISFHLGWFRFVKDLQRLNEVEENLSFTLSLKDLCLEPHKLWNFHFRRECSANKRMSF